MEPIEDDLLKVVHDGVESAFAFTSEDAETVITNVWAKLKVRPGLEEQAELELKPAIREAVTGMELRMSEKGEFGVVFKSRSAEDAFLRIWRGGTWYSSVDIIATLTKLYS